MNKKTMVSKNKPFCQQINGKGRKIIVGMSGGVDSSMALVLLKKQNWQPIGVSLKLPVWKDKKNLLRENICCTTDSLNTAKKICKKLNVPYYVFDVRSDFKKEVIKYFVSELKVNRTPNPCIICNRYLRFKKLFEFGKKVKAKYVATGHYARIRENPKNKEFELLRAKDKNKDQTYFLSFLPQKWLKYIIFPLGDYTKKEIYQMAKEEGFDFFSKKRQSQDFCFVNKGSLLYFLEKEIGNSPGFIKNTQGDVLGKHQGLHFYTIGQRKGINLSGGPYFVKGFEPKKNILIVTKNEKELYQKKVFLSPYYFISGKIPKRKIKVKAKVRYRQPLKSALLFPLKNKKELYLEFIQPQKAITPGQFCVFYKNETCLGGGRIINSQ